MQVQVFIMSYNSNKEKMESNDYKDICRNHSAKADREMYRVCPSKLSKRELEDLYFTLLENNLELKKTINGQQDKIRVLSTQVQRMTYTQEKLVSKEKKDRGTATKAVVDGQKDFITELKETNQRLSDRVQHLNMRLCSAKQFMKTTQPHSAPSKGNRSSATAASTPKRHDCTSKGPESSEQVLKVSTYSQWEENYVEPVKSDQPCDENKCRTLMEDMKLKIATLKTELVNVHEEYATRIGRLETEVLEVRKENIRVISERSASECELTDTFKRASDLLGQYRTFEAKCAELTTELAIERRKVAELETQLRAANMSDKVNKTIEDHLTTKQTLPLILLSERREGLEDTSAKSSPKYSVKSSWSGSKYSYNGRSYPTTATTSEDTNCETCGCKLQLMSAVESRTCSEQEHYYTIPAAILTEKCAMCGYTPHIPQTPPESTSTPVKDKNNDVVCQCPAWVQDGSLKLSPLQDKNNDVVCQCPAWVQDGSLKLSPLQDKNNDVVCQCPAWVQDGSLKLSPLQDLNNDVVCQCPAWMQDGSLKLSPLQDKNEGPAWMQDGSLKLSPLQNASSKCMKCCFKDEHLAMGSHPPTTHAGLSPSAGATSEPGDPCTTNTGDDSGYQDTDDQGLLKQNKELIAKILELQRQVDSLKIRGVGGRPGSSSENLCEFAPNPKKTADNSAIASLPPLLEELPKASELTEDKPSRPPPDTKESAPINPPPLLGETPEVETPVEQIEQSLKDKTYEFMTPLPSEHVIQPRKIIRIEVLGNPKESFAEDSRAKTIENADGTQYITDDPVPVNPDKYGYPDLPNKRHTEHGWDSPKLEIVEKKKHEESIAAINKHDSGNINLNTAMSLGPGPGFNPEKFKYLEAEGLTADVPKIMTKEYLESIPSNPQLGFGIPKLVSKISQERSKAELDSGRQKKSLGTSTALPREPVNQSIPGTHPITSTQTDDTHKLEEDCQYCDACSFDMECAHGIKPTMDKLALEVQKERDKEHDQHNSLQIPGPIVSSDIVKKDKKSLFSHFKKQKKGNQSGEDLVTDPKVYAKKTNITAAGAVNIADVPLFEKSDQQDKKHKPRKRKKESQTKEDVIVNSRVYAQRTCETAAGAVALADVPLLDNQVVGSSKDRRAKDSNEDKADTNQKLPEKSSQAASCKDWSWQSDELPYRRRSGTYSNRARSPGHGPAVCRCVGRQDGSCYLLKNKGIQAAATQENMSPREKRRAVPTSERGTYTLDSKHTETSPDNTDLEMSYLSDLPMEKEKKSPLKPRPLSPGEARSASHSCTQSGPSPPTNYSLSEGEMPAPTKRRHTESDRDRLYLNAHLAHKLETPPLLQMEAALQAITDELQRCRNLLHHQRPAELSPMSPVS